MSSGSTWHDVNAPASATHFDLRDFCGRVEAREQSAIDDYYRYSRQIMLIGKQEELEKEPLLGRLLLLGLVSGVELYVRSILARVISICPDCKSHAFKKAAPLSTVEFYGLEDAGWSLLEHVSLADGDAINKQIKNLLGLHFESTSEVGVALDAFDKLCHLRHASVHARGHLSSANLSSLQLELARDEAQVQFGYSQVQRAGEICENTVRALNSGLYKKILQRWIHERRLRVDWDEDKECFKPLFELFFSKHDLSKPRSAYHAYRPFIKNYKLAHQP